MKNVVTTTLTAVVMMMTLLLIAAPVSADTAETIAAISKQVDESPNAPADLKTYIRDKLMPLCSNEVFVKAVAAQNAKNLSLDAIKKTDTEWQAAEEMLPIHAELTENACAKEILRIAATDPAITETFVMDNQGANVGQNAITSDYWQGDEPKWQNSFNGGKGGVDISEPKLDKSTSKTDRKVSLPIVDASGKVIGAICIGVAGK